MLLLTYVRKNRSFVVVCKSVVLSSCNRLLTSVAVSILYFFNYSIFWLKMSILLFRVLRSNEEEPSLVASEPMSFLTALISLDLSST